MHHTLDPSIRAGQRVAVAGIAASVLLATLNIVVGFITRSTSVVATGFEFAGDVLASTVVLIGTIVAAKSADENHPYGHGRLETLAAFLLGVILVAGGIGICWGSLQAVGETHAPPAAPAVAVLLVAIVLRSVMSVLKFRVGHRIQSAALFADAWNDTVDILAAAAALAAVALARYDSPVPRGRSLWRVRCRDHRHLDGTARAEGRIARIDGHHAQRRQDRACSCGRTRGDWCARRGQELRAQDRFQVSRRPAHRSRSTLVPAPSDLRLSEVFELHRLEREPQGPQ